MLFWSGWLKFLTHFQLRHFILDYKNTLDVFEYFSNNPIIEEIDIPENELTLKIVKAIINKIKNWPKLKTIAVDWNALYADDIHIYIIENKLKNINVLEIKNEYEEKYPFEIIFA